MFFSKEKKTPAQESPAAAGKQEGSPRFEHDAPLNPEQNPPDSLEELDALIKTLQLKAMDIKHQLDIADRKIQAGKPVDEERLNRASYARQRTNHSIAALQQIAKKRRAATVEQYGTSLERQFMLIAKDRLPSASYDEIMNAAHQVVLAQRALSTQAQ